MNHAIAPGYISLEDAALATGMSRDQLARRFLKYNVQIYVNPLDRRSRVIERVAFDGFLAIRPVTPRREVRPT